MPLHYWHRDAKTTSVSHTLSLSNQELIHSSCHPPCLPPPLPEKLAEVSKHKNWFLIFFQNLLELVNQKTTNKALCKPVVVILDFSRGHWIIQCLLGYDWNVSPQYLFLRAPPPFFKSWELQETSKLENGYTGQYIRDIAGSSFQTDLQINNWAQTEVDNL